MVDEEFAQLLRLGTLDARALPPVNGLPCYCVVRCNARCPLCAVSCSHGPCRRCVACAGRMAGWREGGRAGVQQRAGKGREGERDRGGGYVDSLIDCGKPVCKKLLVPPCLRNYGMDLST